MSVEPPVAEEDPAAELEDGVDDPSDGSAELVGDALEDVWRVIRSANAYIDHQAPWALRKTDMDRMGVVLAVLARVIRIVATVLQPFMPGSMARMLDQLAVPDTARALDGLQFEVPAGTVLPAPQGVFPRYVPVAEPC